MRRAAKVDANQSEVIDALRQIGGKVLDLSRVGHGCPDIAVFHGKTWTFLEIKDGAKPPSARKLTDAQVTWHAFFAGAAHVVTSAEEALEIVLAKSQGVAK